MKKVVIFIILLGTIGLALNTIFGWQTMTFISSYNIPNTEIVLYRLDMAKYIQNLSNSFKTVSALQLNVPQQYDFDGDIFALLQYIANGFIMFLNIFLYPLRIGGYLILQILAVLGINTVEIDAAGGLNWLVNIGKAFRDLQIPLLT